MSQIIRNLEHEWATEIKILKNNESSIASYSEIAPKGTIFVEFAPHSAGGQILSYSQKNSFIHRILPHLIKHLSEGSLCVIQLFGPILGSFAACCEHIFSSEANARYYLPSLENISCGTGYIESWVSFEYNEERFQRMSDVGIDADLSGVILERMAEGVYDSIFRKYWGDPKSIVENLSSVDLLFIVNGDWDFVLFMSSRLGNSLVDKLKNFIRHIPIPMSDLLSL